MGQVSSILRSTVDNGLMFWCPGCDGAHQVRHGSGTGPRWTWNGDVHRPTFSPSILVRGRDFTPKGRAEYQEWYDAGAPPLNGRQFESVDTCCHSFVRDGQIQFLNDCTHALAGKTVPIPEWRKPDYGGTHPIEVK